MSVMWLVTVNVRDECGTIYIKKVRKKSCKLKDLSCLNLPLLDYI